MNKIDHPAVKKALAKKIVGLVLGLALIAIGVLGYKFSAYVTEKEEQEAISFAEAYNEDRLGEDIMVYVEVTEEPYEFAYRDNGPHYYFVYDGYDWYIMQALESYYDEMVDGIKKHGYFDLVGSIEKISDEEIIEFAIDTFNEGETDPDKLLTREGFDNYFRGVMIKPQGHTNSSELILVLATLLAIVGAILFFVYLVGLINYFTFMNSLDDYQAQYLANELYNPQTVYIKTGDIYMSPTCLISLGHRTASIPYNNMLWAYRYQFRYWFIPIYSNISIIKRDFAKATVAVLPGFFTNTQALGRIFGIIQAYNPQVRIGFSTQNQTYVRELRKQGVAPYGVQ